MSIARSNAYDAFEFGNGHRHDTVSRSAIADLSDIVIAPAAQRSAVQQRTGMPTEPATNSNGFRTP